MFSIVQLLEVGGNTVSSSLVILQLRVSIHMEGNYDPSV